ncbi:protein kinase domain-containing protein [Streptomyces jeddahensis]|uniref:Serine/threonine-protein kinase PK-1 n=1 Tax=Streptomyces jeddahensis TaxID=1716141 RepID=A0A177HZK8_9ACTN|nr:protein kinase [Streptomyces jeddahensis]OAH16255.1 serine/threonine-protein kinase PK-1 [Streptomyces jeddahensis]
MDDYAGRVLADRYRLPLPPSDEYELAQTRAFDTFSGQEVLVTQVQLPEVVEAEVLDAEGRPEGFAGAGPRRAPGRATRRPTDPAVRRAIEAAQAAAQIPDHPRLDQVFDVFADGGSLWIVSELVAARPLAALLAEKPLTPYRAAEVASDVLTALRALHAHGWVHRNITTRTVLVCEDGRVMLTGLAAGAAEEALCGYDPRPAEDFAGADDFAADGEAGDFGGPGDLGAAGAADGASGAIGADGAADGVGAPGGFGTSASGRGDGAGGPRPVGAPAIGPSHSSSGAAVPTSPSTPAGTSSTSALGRPAPQAGGDVDVRAARAGAIAAYRAGARAAARVTQERRPDVPPSLPAPRSDQAPHPDPSYAPRSGQVHGVPDQVHGVRGEQPWHGAVPRARGVAGQPDDTQGPSEAGAEAGAQAQAQPGGEMIPAARHDGSSALAASGGNAPGTGTDTSNSSTTSSTGTRWDELVAPGRRSGGPTTPLAAERARQARMVVVGPVTERWAPEQAGPVHENWQLAPPVGPATDLWALGALLFRAVQGHAPYPEESTAELVQLVCAEPPAFAEECGPLRPVVESLLRQDPTERIDFEELRGWLRSLVRSAPEPDAGANVVATPPYDTGRLPVVRRRGEIVRKRRAAAPATTGHSGRHKRAKPGRQPRQPRQRGPKALGRTLLLLILLGLAAAIAYAMLFMPKAQPRNEGGQGQDRTGTAGEASAAASSGGSEAGAATPGGGSQHTQTTGPELPEGFVLRKDPEGFQIAVARGWDRHPANDQDQVRYTDGGFTLIVVSGRDSTSVYGGDPMTYQREKEPELQPFRDSSWASSSGMRTIEVGGRTMAEGQFTWQDAKGREIYVRNLALIIDGRYHVVQVRGPEAERDEVTRLYEQASATYQVTG